MMATYYLQHYLTHALQKFEPSAHGYDINSPCSHTSRIAFLSHSFTYKFKENFPLQVIKRDIKSKK